jgi:hypothetical protein
MISECRDNAPSGEVTDLVKVRWKDRITHHQQHWIGKSAGGVILRPTGAIVDVVSHSHVGHS